MTEEGDTIAAVATGAGPGGVGIIRISGPRAALVLARLLGKADAAFPDRRFVCAVARDPISGERLDQVLAVVMRAPRSYTGEDVAEVHGHGGNLNLARILRAATKAGARLAEPGEFTRRAFENGRLDLMQAEAVALVISAASERALRAAQGQLEGGLGTRVVQLRDAVIALCGEAEAAIDFAEEDLSLMAPADLGKKCTELAKTTRALAETYRVGRALHEGLQVALVGATNVGKSSLLNAFMGEERSVVDAEPGTTRDYVEGRVVWDGVPLTLVDTAGERSAESAVERRGIELGRRRAGRADVLVRVVDATHPQVVSTPGELVVWNKVDLAPAPEGALGVSALMGSGLDALKARILGLALGQDVDSQEDELVTSERQRDLLERAALSLVCAGEAAVRLKPMELVASDLRLAAQALGQIHGVDVLEGVLDYVFSSFCIGK